MDMLLASNKELFAFKKAVIHKILEWPFFYNEGLKDEQWVD